MKKFVINTIELKEPMRIFSFSWTSKVSESLKKISTTVPSDREFTFLERDINKKDSDKIAIRNIV